MSERMTEERLDQITARADAATPGPWKHRAVEPLAKWPSVFVNEVEAPQSDACWIAKVMDHRSCIATPPGDGNASFIAASRTDIPDMAREIRVLWEDRDALQAQCDDLLRPIAESADAGMKERDAMREAWLAEMERFAKANMHDSCVYGDHFIDHMREWSEKQGGKE